MADHCNSPPWQIPSIRLVSSPSPKVPGPPQLLHSQLQRLRPLDLQQVLTALAPSVEVPKGPWDPFGRWTSPGLYGGNGDFLK